MVDAAVKELVEELRFVLHILVPHVQTSIDVTDQDVRVRLGLDGVLLDVVIEEVGSCWTVWSFPGTSLPLRRRRGITATQSFRYVVEHVTDHLDVLAADQLVESSRTAELRALVRSLASQSDPFRRF